MFGAVQCADCLYRSKAAILCFNKVLTQLRNGTCIFVRYRLFFCFCVFFLNFTSFVRESKYFTRSACGGVHTDVCESDSKASVSSHVHYTHSLWQQKGGKKGLAVAHTAGGISRGCL